MTLDLANMMTGFLIILEDTHADPAFKFCWKKGDAINEAKQALSDCCQVYNIPIGKMHYSSCNGQCGFWFYAESPCGSFHVSVREISVPDLDTTEM